MNPAPYLNVARLRKVWGGPPALDDVSLTAVEGSRTAIVGPSGSGKTTLLRIIAGFEAPDAGSVTLGGTALAQGPRIMPAHKRGIGLVAQDGALFPHLDVAANIGFGLPAKDPSRRETITRLIAMVELAPALLTRKPHELSGGQQQRVALARALALKPRLMLLDEPFSALDTGLRVATRKAIARTLAQAGVTTILVTHDQGEALSFADQVAVMREGRLVQIGAPRNLYHRPRDRMIAEFLGDAIILDAEIADGVAHCALGALAVDDPARRGKATIMLRPEQLTILPGRNRGAQQGGTEPSGIRAEVLAVEFGGATCDVRARVVSADDGKQAVIALRSGSTDPPAVGAIVRLVTIGAAHVLGA